MNWMALKALHDIYLTGRTRSRKTLLSDPEIRHFIRYTGELVETRSELFDPAWDNAKESRFRKTYERDYLDNFCRYRKFLQEMGLETPHTRFEEDDINTLMFVKSKMDNGRLCHIRTQIIAAKESLRGISLMFFPDEKYLDRRFTLVNALKIIMNVSEFANDKKQQWLYKLQCHDSKLIILCENLNLLTMPTFPRRHHIELWYAGGKNVDKLDYVDSRGLPIYYCCDWDHDGLSVFQMVKEKIPQIQMLYPTGDFCSIVTTKHKSHWQYPNDPDQLLGLDAALFSVKEQLLIKRLIVENCWVIEESNKLPELLEANSLLDQLMPALDPSDSLSYPDARGCTDSVN